MSRALPRHWGDLGWLLRVLKNVPEPKKGTPGTTRFKAGLLVMNLFGVEKKHFLLRP